MIKSKEELKKARKQMFDQMEERWQEVRKPEDDVFYLHPDEARIVLSHALFWVMSKPLAYKLTDNKTFLLLRQYEEEMLDAYLTDSPEFDELFRYSNLAYNILIMVMRVYIESPKTGHLAKKLAAIALVASGYGGDMADDLADELLDDMDFNKYNKVICPKIEQMQPMLNKMVEDELKNMEINL